ncbi:MAG: hypothetical protein MUF87_09505 [Anaerolineae bacterium]|jgi:hypothetical protein|nr:hypothetical protein [Anaerolineae bacterium]
MGIDLYWDDEQLTTLLCVFDGRWTWPELFAVIRTIQQITEDLTHPVGAIIDVRKRNTFPDGNLLTLENLENAKKLLSMGDGKAGHMVFVGASPMIRSAYTILKGINPHTMQNVVFLDTVREARDYLREAV